MKKYLSVVGMCLILFACGNPFSSSSSEPEPARNYTYHFDENSGAVTANSDGDGYLDGIIYGASWVPGKIGSALHFGPASGSRVEIPMQYPDYEITFDDSISIGCWIKLDDLPQYESYQIVGSGSGGLQSFRLQVNMSGQIEFILDDNPGWTTIVTSSQTLTQGNWYQITLTYDETTGRTYINGIEDNSYTTSFNIPINYNRIYIGANDYSNQLVGTIDELRISKDLWTPQQILEYYNSTN